MPTGTWLLGMEGSRRLAVLSGRLEQMCLRRASEVCRESFRAYVPWMCSEAHLADLAPLFKRGPTDLVITDREILGHLEGAYSTPGSRVPIRLGFDLPLDVYIFVEVEQERPDARSTIQRAVEIVLASDPVLSAQFRSLIDCIVPYVAPDGATEAGEPGTSSQIARGAIFHTLPDIVSEASIFRLAIDLAHELGHQALMTYQAADPLLMPDSFEKPIYSAVRRTERPAILALHAMTAVAYMIQFLRGISASEFARESSIDGPLRLLESDFAEGLAALSTCRFTALGREIHSEFESLAKEA